MTVALTLQKAQVVLLKESIDQAIEQLERSIELENNTIATCHDHIACNDYDDIDKLVDDIKNAEQRLIYLKDMLSRYVVMQTDLNEVPCD